MSQPTSIAAGLSPASRKSLAIEALSKAEPISHLAAQHQVSRKFLNHAQVPQVSRSF